MIKIGCSLEDCLEQILNKILLLSSQCFCKARNGYNKSGTSQKNHRSTSFLRSFCIYLSNCFAATQPAESKEFALESLSSLHNKRGIHVRLSFRGSHVGPRFVDYIVFYRRCLEGLLYQPNKWSAKLLFSSEFREEEKSRLT